MKTPVTFGYAYPDIVCNDALEKREPENMRISGRNGIRRSTGNEMRFSFFRMIYTSRALRAARVVFQILRTFSLFLFFVRISRHDGTSDTIRAIGDWFCFMGIEC